MIAATVYVLCAITSFICTWMLARGYRRTKVRLLWWSAWCFAGLTLNNILLVIDRTFPEPDLSSIRAIPALIGAGLLIWGLIRDTA